MTDKWADWLLNKRYGSNIENKKKILEALYPIRDKIISNTDINQGDIALDIGCGDGLIGIALLEKVGKNGRVIFNDISKELLESCKKFLETQVLQENAVFFRIIGRKPRRNRRWNSRCDNRKVCFNLRG